MKKSLKSIMNDLGISSQVLDATKPIKKPTHFNSVKRNIPMIPNYNMSSDILFLPKTSDGYKYLLVITDLATDNFDCEPLKNKDSKTVLKAMTKIFETSKYIKKPYASFSTDAGSEFKDVVDKYLYDNNIYHKKALPGRHTQQANVESLNRILGRILNNYMSEKELETGHIYTNWLEILHTVIKKINDFRKKPMPDNIYDQIYPNFEIVGKKIKTKNKSESKKISINNLFDGKTDGHIYEETSPKYNVGQMVYRKLDKPKNMLGHNQATEKFKEGDVRWEINEPRKIKRILYFNTQPYYRYILNDVPNVSYPESELRPSLDEEEKYIIQSIKSKKKIKGKIYYEIKWKGYSKTTWEPRSELIKDIPDLINEYESKA